MFRVIDLCARLLSGTAPFRIQLLKFISVTAGALLVVGCSWSNFGSEKSTQRLSKRVVDYGQPVPKGGGVYKIGNPYKVGSQWYKPREEPGYDEVGVASWYGELFHGRYTANGEVYDMDALTAAHPTLPLPSYVRVTNRDNGKSLVVRVNDRGPYANDRIIDLSRKTADLLGFERAGTAPVRVTYIKPAPLNGDDGYERWYLSQQRWANPGPRYSSRRSNRRYASRNNYDRMSTGSSRYREPSRRHYSRKRPYRHSYIVQAGLFRDRWNANRLKARVARYGHSFVEATRSGSSPVYRVMMGPFKSRRQANYAADRVEQVGIYDAVILRN